MMSRLIATLATGAILAAFGCGGGDDDDDGGPMTIEEAVKAGRCHTSADCQADNMACLITDESMDEAKAGQWPYIEVNTWDATTGSIISTQVTFAGHCVANYAGIKAHCTINLDCSYPEPATGLYACDNPYGEEWEGLCVWIDDNGGYDEWFK